MIYKVYDLVHIHRSIVDQNVECSKSEPKHCGKKAKLPTENPPEIRPKRLRECSSPLPIMFRFGFGSVFVSLIVFI